MFLCWSVTVFANITIIDYSETMIVLAEPAEKTVSGSSHLTEFLFILGVGDRIKATLDFFDYPEAAGFTSHLGLVLIEIRRLIM